MKNMVGDIANNMEDNILDDMNEEDFVQGMVEEMVTGEYGRKAGER